jgi:hypothetical protein
MTIWLALLFALVTALAGCSADGGPTGTGISSISGNVIEVTAGTDNQQQLTEPIAGVRVSIDEAPGIEDATDTEGNFELTGDFAGAVTLRFTTERVSATQGLNVPGGSAIVLENVEIGPRGVRIGAARQLGFFGEIAFVDCDTGDILVNDRRPHANQFLVRLSSETLIVNGDGSPLSCDDLAEGDPVAIQGAIRLADGTIQAITVTVSPPSAGRPSPLVELRFVGTVTAINCESRMLLVDDATGRSRLNLSDTTEVVGPGNRPLRCEDIMPGQRVQGVGLIRVRRPGVIDVLEMLVLP